MLQLKCDIYRLLSNDNRGHRVFIQLCVSSSSSSSRVNSMCMIALGVTFISQLFDSQFGFELTLNTLTL